MKPVGAGGPGTVAVRALNGGGTGIAINSGGPVTYVRLSPAATLTQITGGTGQSQAVPPLQQQQQINNGAGGPVIFRRLQNNNVVQIRRIVTQQPQQLSQLGDLSSSDSSGGFEARRNGGTGRGGNEKDEEMCVDDEDSMGEVDLSIVDRGEGEEDEELLIDHDEDDGERMNGEGKTVREMNGEQVDSEYLRQVIETQILNRHTARIKDWDGTKGHMCQSCHETFLSENGLEAHRNRKIHHILFYCRYCKRDLSFFNKCRLLQHLRNHRVTPTVSGLQNCTMIRLLPESEYLHFKYEDCTSSSDEEKGGSGAASSGSNPPKRPKPSKFRRIARSSLSGNGLDSDHSPPPSITRQIVAPPQQLSATSPPPTSSTAVQITSTSTNAIGTIKYAPAATNGEEKQRNDQLTVIKSTGNTTSVILSSPGLSDGSPPPPKESCSSPNSDSPQIRIRNLSQLTVSVNDEEDEGNQNQNGNDNYLETQPKALPPPPLIRPAPTETKKVSTAQSKSQAKKEYICYKCDKNFSCGRDFFKHLEEQEARGLSSRSLHRCPTDDIPSWSQCQYVFHTKLFHEKSVPFMCPGCGDESSDYNSLMEHVTNNCFYLSLRARYMCAATAQKCNFGDKKSVKTEPEIIDHLKKEHSRAVLQCVQCTQGFATENWLLKHLGDVHKISFDDSKGDADREAFINKMTRPLTQCLLCNILFPNCPTYLQHVYLNFHMHILHAKMLECQSCFAVFETTEDIMNHRKQSDKCRKLDPSKMRICSLTNDQADNSPEQSVPAPTQIKIVTNPTAKVEHKPQSTQQTQKQFNSTPVAVISTSNQNPNRIQMASQLQRSQKPQQALPRNPPHLQNASQKMPNSPAKPAPQAQANRMQKRSFFDELQSCQFCDRLVVFSSLRKHEDQCCGLSTVAPGFCLTCRKNFGDKKSLARHGIVHIEEGIPICLFCNNRHIRPTHPKSLTPSQHENLYALKKHLYSNHTSKAVHFPFQCPLCSKMCNDKRSAEFHIKDHQFKYTTTDPVPVPLPTSQDDIRRLIKIRRKGMDPRRKVAKIIDVYYCPVCKNREFSQECGLARHLKLVHQKNPKTLNLGLLKKASTARRFVLKAPESSTTVQNTPQQRPQLRSVSSSSDSRRTGALSTATRVTRNSVTVSSSSTSQSFTSRFSSGTVLRKRIVAATSVITGRKPTPAPPQKTVPSTRLRSSSSTESPRPPTNFLNRSTKSARNNGTFSCFRCPDFSCKTENAFCDHIKWKHVWSEAEIQKLQYGNKAGLEEPSEYWCPECNTMFVAKPSLVRHLKFAHDYIANVDEFMQKIGYDGKKPLKQNQCEVCYYQCVDDRDLQQHIRTHGMAFLRLRQQRQSQMNMKS